MDNCFSTVRYVTLIHLSQIKNWISKEINLWSGGFLAGFKVAQSPELRRYIGYWLQSMANAQAKNGESLMKIWARKPTSL